MKVDTVLPSVHMKVTDNASNIKKAFSFFDGGFFFLHTLELVVREFMEDDSVKPWLMKIKGLCRHLKMSLTGWSCFVELCDMKHRNCQASHRRSDQVGRASRTGFVAH